MRVYFIPDYTVWNPYQRELADALSKHEISVYMFDASESIPFIKAVLNHGKPDLFHIHWTHSLLLSSTRLKTVLLSLCTIFELFFLKLIGVRLVWTVHNLWGHESQYLARKMEVLLNRLLFRLYDKVIVHSPNARKVVIQTFRIPSRLQKKIHTIPHGNYLDSYPNFVTKEESRSLLGLDKDSTVILFLGIIRSYKGIFNLINEFKRLDNQSANLIIAGKPLNSNIGFKVVKSVQDDKRIRTFLKFIPNDDIQLFMNASDSVVCPFHEVLTSGSVMLALSFGKLVISPDLSCLTDLLDHKNSIQYSYEEHDGLFRALTQSLDSDFDQMGKCALEKSRYFGWDIIADKTVNAYRQCIESKKFLTL